MVIDEAPTQSEGPLETMYNIDMVATIPVRKVALSEMKPLERWRFVARHDPAEVVIWALGLVGGLYITFRSIHELVPGLDALFGMEAMAQDKGLPAPGARDPFDWYVGLLMGITLLISQAIVAFATTDSKIAHGKDMTKMILGFVVGFLSGKKGA